MSFTYNKFTRHALASSGGGSAMPYWGRRKRPAERTGPGPGEAVPGGPFGPKGGKIGGGDSQGPRKYFRRHGVINKPDGGRLTTRTARSVRAATSTTSAGRPSGGGKTLGPRARRRMSRMRTTRSSGIRGTV